MSTAKRDRRFIRKHVGIIVLLAIVSILTYANTFKNDFAYDDTPRIVTNDHIKKWSSLSNIIAHSSRPLRNITFMIDYSLWQLNPVGWHLTNIILHSIASIFVFLLARFLLTGASPIGDLQLTEHSVFWIAGGAALLFATHPVHTEAVTGISNRQESLMTIFLLAAMLAWGRRSKMWLWYPLSLGFVVFAIASKEAALIAPLLLILQDLWCRKSLQGKYLLRFMPFLLAGLWLIKLNNRLFDLEILANFNHLQKLYIMSWAFLKYLLILLWPNSLSTHVFMPVRSHIDGMVLFSWGLLVLAGVFIWRRFRNRHLLGYLTAAYLISMLPYSNLLPYSWIVAERYLYFPSVFFCLALSWLLFHALARLPFGFSTSQHAIAFALIIVIVSSAYLVTALDRNRDWRNEETLMIAAIRTDPMVCQPYFCLGYLMAEKGRFQEAISYYQGALRISPSARTANNLGHAYMKLGKYEKANSVFQLVLAEYPEHQSTIYNMACLASLQSRPAEAMQWLQRLAELGSIRRFPISDDPDLEAFRASKYYEMLMQTIRL